MSERRKRLSITSGVSGLYLINDTATEWNRMHDEMAKCRGPRIFMRSALLLGLLALTACAPVTLRTETLTPINVQTILEIRPSWPNPQACGCKIVAWGSLLGVQPPGVTQFQVGFDNSRDTTCSSACESYIGESIYGMLSFDLKRFVGKGLTSAVLKFRRTSDPASIPPDASSLWGLELWDGGGLFKTRFFNSPQPIRTLPTGANLNVNDSTGLKIANTTYFSVDISTALRKRLLDGKSTDIYFVGDPQVAEWGSHVNDKKVFSWYEGFALEVTFNPNL